MPQNPDKEKWNEFDWELELRKDDARVNAYAADLPKFIDLPDEDGVIMNRMRKRPDLAPAGGDWSKLGPVPYDRDDDEEDEDEEDEDILPEPKEWKITVFNESDMGEEQCAAIRKNGGVILLIPFGNDVSRKTERMLSFLKNQDCNVYGIIVTEADEEYLNRYFA